ncbi:hypothetical protein QYF61_012819 [Mycteria americana]|uniref:Uncharacterized protein n=1 Tax=Mycteria americana TaxID=33587 RepID=A0AAN7RNV7_MYCAM|nr:hypothetical protein QYF61_012819 [Mycteria americana]
MREGERKFKYKLRVKRRLRLLWLITCTLGLCCYRDFGGEVAYLNSICCREFDINQNKREEKTKNDEENKITESQNRIGWKRPLRSSSPTVNLTLPRPPLYHVPKHLIQTSFKYLQGWRLNHFPGQPVPMLDNPFTEVKFPNIQSKPPLVQLEAISSCPITCYLGEETNPHISTTSFQTSALDPSPASLPFSGHAPAPQCLSCSGGPKTEHSIRGAASPVPGVQGHDHFPSPAGHTIFDTSQDAIGFLGHLGTLLAHIQAAVNKHPQVLFCLAAFQPPFPKPVALHGVVVAQVQDLALGLVKPHTIDLGPLIQPVQVPLQSLPTLKQINTPAKLGVICRLTEGALDPFIQIIDKDVKQNWPQHRALGNTTCDRPPTGVNSIHHHSLGPAIQPVLYPVKSTPVQAMSSQLLQENALIRKYIKEVSVDEFVVLEDWNCHVVKLYDLYKKVERRAASCTAEEAEAGKAGGF